MEIAQSRLETSSSFFAVPRNTSGVRVKTPAQDGKVEVPSAQETAQTVAESAELRLNSMQWLPCTLTVDLPLVGFTIGNLLKLSKGMLVETSNPGDAGVPVQLNGKPIALSDIETVGDKLAFRIAEIL